MAAYLDKGVPWVLLSPSLNHRLLDVLLGMLGSALIFGTFSFIGWTLVGVPVVFLVPLRIVNRLPWSAIIAIAALLGPAAFLPIFLILFHGQITADSFSLHRAGGYWVLSCIASVVGFPTYCWLVRRRLRISAASPQLAAHR